MKDFSSTNFNLESKLIQKGILDLKAFWQFIDDKYFKFKENLNVDPVNSLIQLLIKQSELPFFDKKDLKDNQVLNKFYEELSQEGFKTGKFEL